MLVYVERGSVFLQLFVELLPGFGADLAGGLSAARGVRFLGSEVQGLGFLFVIRYVGVQGVRSVRRCGLTDHRGVRPGILCGIF